MKLFFKHLARSARSKPLQPLILIFTLALAIAVNIFVFSLDRSVDMENDAVQQARYGSADIKISLNSSSDSRFMFESDADDLLGGVGDALGILELPVTLGDRSFFGVAADLTSVGDHFDLIFSEYNELTSSAVSSAAFISSDFASENSLKMGDWFKVTAFGSQRSYYVSGISGESLLGKYDLLVDISGVTRLIASDSLILSPLGDKFKPCSLILVSLADSSDKTLAMNMLSSSDKFSDKNVSWIADEVGRQGKTMSHSLIMDVSVIIGAAICMAVVFCAFFILSYQRREENYSFSLSGASPSMLYIMQYAEGICYWAVSVLLGIPLALIPLSLTLHIAGFSYVTPYILPTEAVLSSLLILGVLLLTTTLFILSSRTRGRLRIGKRTEDIISIISFALLVIGAVLLYLLPSSESTPLFVALVTIFIIAIFFCAPFVLRLVLGCIGRICEKLMNKRVSRRPLALGYAVKNVLSLKILSNMTRLTSVLMALLLCISSVVISTNGFLKYVKNLFDADYVLVNAGERCANLVESCDSVGASYGMYYKDDILAVSHIEAISDDFGIDRLPQGDETVISLALAKYYGVQVGDSLVISHDGRELLLTVSQIISTSYNMVIVNAEHHGIGYDKLLVKGREGVSTHLLLSEISDKTALELVGIIGTEELFKDVIHSTKVFLTAGTALTLILAMFALIGMIDTLYESYRSRREEFKLYLISGMDKRTLLRMKSIEIILILLVGVLVGFVAFLPGLAIMEQGMFSVKYETLAGVLYALK